ncbi:MAG: lytic transglycosylase domain-containing protein [Cellulosilyticaceae bacterium]
MAYPRLYREQVEVMSKKYEVDPLFIYAIIKTESKFNTSAISRSGAKGLMQIMDGTGQWGAEMCEIQDYTTEKLFDPWINIQIGCWYISKLLDQYQGNIDLALAAYNAGSGNVARWRANTNYSSDGKNIHTIPFKETDNYLKRVKKNYILYKELYAD